jgi:hypothetical protein
MPTLRLILLACFFAVQLCVAGPLAHHVMLSWKPSGQPWHFAFYSNLPLPYSIHDIGRPDMIVVGLPALRVNLEVLPTIID